AASVAGPASVLAAGHDLASPEVTISDAFPDRCSHVKTRVFDDSKGSFLNFRDEAGESILAVFCGNPKKWRMAPTSAIRPSRNKNSASFMAAAGL
ncbi:MAG: hypothetical protein ACI9ZH_002005, partial [Paracoccaceae bacterium]